jgi:hypothetical protein
MKPRARSGSVRSSPRAAGAHVPQVGQDSFEAGKVAVDVRDIAIRIAETLPHRSHESRSWCGTTKLMAAAWIWHHPQ